jgi:hypothetical protein
MIMMPTNGWKGMEGFNQKAREMKLFLAKFCLVFANLNANEIETFLWLYSRVLFLAEILGDKYWM